VHRDLPTKADEKEGSMSRRNPQPLFPTSLTYVRDIPLPSIHPKLS
jgi:hypothetical protein